MVEVFQAPVILWVQIVPSERLFGQGWILFSHEKTVEKHRFIFTEMFENVFTGIRVRVLFNVCSSVVAMACVPDDNTT